MSTAEEPIQPSSERPLRLRLRKDLVAKYQLYQGKGHWVLKDPTALKYYRFEEEEYALLQLLDGAMSLRNLQCEFNSRFAPQTISLPELHHFVARLHRHCLVVSDAPGQGMHLAARSTEQAGQRRRAVLRNILWWRWSGFDPNQLLGSLNRSLGWVFSAVALWLAMLWIAAAGLLVAVEFDQFLLRLPSFREFFGPGNWLLLAGALAGAKVLHEFGHGMCCRRFGGECHEMGVLLLLFTPCLYCDVTDSWMIPSKWQRAMVGAAGMYFELVLAATCTFIWWFTHPGTLHYLCLNVMFVSSVSTLLFNANPLLRYDGYYILSDLVEIPNLRQKSQSALEQCLASWLVGLRGGAASVDRSVSALLSMFGLASLLYRWVVTVSILLFLATVLAPYGLESLGQLLAGVVGTGMVLAPLNRFWRFAQTPGSLERVSKLRFLTTLSLGLGVLAALLLWPWPHYVRCPVYVQPREAATVYVEVPGSLQQVHVMPAQYVAAGEPLVTLENLDLELLLSDLEMRRLQLETRRAHLVQRSLQDEAAGMEIEELSRTLGAIDSQYQQRQKELQQMVLRAPCEGWVIPAAHVPFETAPDQLRRWAGHPLERHNLGATIAEGEPICLVGDPSTMTAMLMIHQSDLEFLQPRQPVDLFFKCLPGKRFQTRLEYVSRRALQVSPRSLSTKAGGSLVTATDSHGRERPSEATYQASAALIELPAAVVSGATGAAKVYVGKTPLVYRLWRLAHRTFRFSSL